MSMYKARAVVYKSILGAALTAILYVASYDKLITFSLCNLIIELNAASLTLKGCILVNRTSGFVSAKMELFLNTIRALGGSLTQLRCSL